MDRDYDDRDTDSATVTICSSECRSLAKLARGGGGGSDNYVTYHIEFLASFQTDSSPIEHILR